MVHPPRAADHLPWSDRFNMPAIETLRDGMPANTTDYFDHARTTLLELSHNKERIVWNGSAWRWTIAFGGSVRRSSSRRRPSRPPIAVMIPNPDDFQIAVPVQNDFLESVWNRRMKRTFRDGLELAAAPYDTEMGIWSINAKSLLEEVLKLIREKLEFRLAN